MTDLPKAPNRSARLGMGGALIGVGFMHFVAPKSFDAIIPEAIPAKRFWVYATGVAEIAGGAALLKRPTRKLGWMLVGLLLLVFPANINMAINSTAGEGMPAIPRWALWARLPMQFVMIWAVLAATRPGPATERSPT